MMPKKARATAEAVAQTTSHEVFYQSHARESSVIDDLLTGLLFALQSPHLTSAERTTALDSVDDLIRLKADLGLLRGGKTHG